METLLRSATDLVNIIQGGYPFLLVIVLLLLAIAKRHREQLYQSLAIMNLLMAAAGLLVLFMSLYQLYTIQEEGYSFANRAFGPYWFAYWFMLLSATILPQFFWFKKFRRSIPLSVIACLIPFGGIYERFVILITSYHRDYLPASWGVVTTAMIGPMLQSTLLLLMLVLLVRLFIYQFKKLRLKGSVYPRR